MRFFSEQFFFVNHGKEKELLNGLSRFISSSDTQKDLSVTTLKKMSQSHRRHFLKTSFPPSDDTKKKRLHSALKKEVFSREV